MKVANLTPGYYIGFGGEFYTLWYVNPADIRTGSQDAGYIKNISKDKHEAATCYPEAKFAFLKGDAWLATKKVTYDKVNSQVFEFGKYIGQEITNCNDIRYLDWFYHETKNIFAKSRLFVAGYVMGANGRVISPKEQIAISRAQEIHESFNGEIELRFVTNVKADGTINAECPTDEGQEDHPFGYTLDLSEDLMAEVVWKSYNGYEYGVIGNARSMKKSTWKVTTDDGLITSIK